MYSDRVVAAFPTRAELDRCESAEPFPERAADLTLLPAYLSAPPARLSHIGEPIAQLDAVADHMIRMAAGNLDRVSDGARRRRRGRVRV